MVAAAAEAGREFDREAFQAQGTRDINKEAARQEREATYSIGNACWKGDSSISPIRGLLATWGLTPDDISVAYMHGTSTVLNEKNELEILQRQLSHLGRSRGNRLFGVFQKHLTGHPKGAAGAWMLNGALQTMQSGSVPGNCNADNIDEALRSFDFIAVPNRTIQIDEVAAFSLTSFGFGQKGTQAIGVHPRYLYATLSAARYESYRARVAQRKVLAEQFLNDGMRSRTLVQVKSAVRNR